jgi:hydroxyacylglutathione hydrolase
MKSGIDRFARAGKSLRTLTVRLRRIVTPVTPFQQSEMFGFPVTAAFKPDYWLKDGDRVSCGTQTFKVLHCPGHTPGHVDYYHDAGIAFVDDGLFRGSIGRTDLRGGNQSHLIESIRRKLWPLGDDVIFVPGHGPESTFGYERRTNPFVADDLFDQA